MSMRTHDPHPLLVAAILFIAAVLITVAVWIVLPDSFRVNRSTDYTRFYEPYARELLQGGMYRDANGQVYTRYPPGYPLILAGVFALSDAVNVPEDVLINGFILLCVGLSVVLVFAIARGIWGTLPAILAAVVWMTYPFYLWLTVQPNSELPFIPLVLLSFGLLLFALQRRSSNGLVWALCGVAAGFAMLIRPAVIGLAVLFPLMALVFLRVHLFRRISAACAVLLGCAVMVIPWIAYVYSVNGVIIPISAGGERSIIDGLTFASTFQREREGDVNIALPDSIVKLQDDLVRMGNPNLTNIRAFLERKWNTEPLTVLHFGAIKAARSWFGTDSGRFETPALILQVLYLIPIGWSAITMWRKGGQYRLMLTCVVIVVLYFWATTFAVLSILRYMLPAMALLMVVLPALADRFMGARTAKAAPISA
jgi:4-amino-4-deoxy-L-arabinose transferase-like glycosyltransferase